jgi:hypothetical protein
MEQLTKDEMNLVIQLLTRYEDLLKDDIKANIDGETDYDAFNDDKADLETVWNILKKLRG